MSTKRNSPGGAPKGAAVRLTPEAVQAAESKKGKLTRAEFVNSLVVGRSPICVPDLNAEAWALLAEPQHLLSEIANGAMPKDLERRSRAALSNLTTLRRLAVCSPDVLP